MAGTTGYTRQAILTSGNRDSRSVERVIIRRKRRPVKERIEHGEGKRKNEDTNCRGRTTVRDYSHDIDAADLSPSKKLMLKYGGR